MADIEVEIWYIPESAGGRHGPVATGYRPQFFYEGEDWDAIHEYPNRDWIQPGEKAIAHLTFTRPEHHLGRVYVGMPFLLREGKKTVGYGVTRAILALEASAAAAPRPSK